MMPVFASPLTSANALSMLWPSRAVCSRPGTSRCPCLAKASELVVLAALIQGFFERYRPSLPMQPALIEDEESETLLRRRVGLVFGDQRRLLVDDVERRLLAGMAAAFFSDAMSMASSVLVREAFGTSSRGTPDLRRRQEVRKHLEQVWDHRSRRSHQDPHRWRSYSWCTPQQRCDSLRGVVGEDVLLDLDAGWSTSSALTTPSMERVTSLRKISFSFIGSCFLVEGCASRDEESSLS